jgi:hypothetical protein
MVFSSRQGFPWSHSLWLLLKRINRQTASFGFQRCKGSRTAAANDQQVEPAFLVSITL